MVFESLVSDLLNKVIGDYVENLDKSQLKIGIWGGNVVLENLRVKESALSEFDVPFRVKAGQIGKLTLKIPWKNLYNDAVVATLHGLYLLVVPRATIKYDAAKEERYQQEAKQKELQRIEEALQMASRRASQTGDMLFSLEKVVYQEPHHGRMFSALALTAVSLFNAAKNSKGPKKTKKPKKGLRKLKRHNNETDKAPEEKKDTLMEKLVTQVIKNLQVKISNIHLRYEDDLSYPQCPLSMGVTLSELSLQTTNQNWKACILNEAGKVIYKLGRLDCLCAYWNVNSPVWYKASWEAIMEQLKGGIRSSDQELALYQYIFRPIFSSAKIILTPNAELDLKTPKAQIHLEIKNISVEMTRPQYRTMVELLESIDSMVKNAPYRKFRPDVPVHHSPRVWWTYAFSCILEVHIRRLSHMWSWSNIRQHRQNLKAYKTVYKTKLLSQNKIQNQDTERQIQDLEKVLDVFNITLARQQAHMEVIRSGQKVVARRNQKQGGATGGFFSSWFGRRSKKEVQEESKETESSGLDDLMTAEEKEKLYTTIGYSASSHNVALPKQYVALVVTFQLFTTSITIREQPDVPEILKVQIIDLSTRLSQRPGAQAFRVEAALKHWFVTGLQQQGALTSLIASVGDSASSLLTVVFEANPEESTADQLLRVHSQPVEIIYDALTVNSLADFFRIGKGIDLEVLTSATLSKLEEMKEKTATGLSHIIETRKVLDLRIDLKPSYLLVPKTGFYSCTSDVIIINFGNFQLNSVDQSSSTSSSSLEEIMDRAYERYQVELRRVQVLYRKSGEAWEADWHQASSVQHILQPVDLTVQLAKCMVEKDARMPRFKVSGELPLLHIKISDEKIHNFLDLINSIPLPNMESSPSTPMEKALPLVDAGSRVRRLHPILLDAMETDSDDDTSERSTDEGHQRTALEDLTLLHFKFEVKEVLLELTQQGEQEKTILSFIVRQLGAEVKMRSFDMSVTSYLRSVALDYCDVPDDTCRLHLISSSECHWSDLLKVEFIKADPSGPSFQTRFSSTEQTLKVEFSSVDFLLHTNALLSTINYLSNAMPPQYTTARDHNSKKQVEKSWLGQTASKGAKDVGVFSFKLFAMLGCFHVEVFDDHHSIADIRVRGADLSVQVAAGQTEVFAHLRDIVVKDIDPYSVHKQVVSIMGEELFSFRLSLLAGETEGEGYSNMSKVDGMVTMRLGCIRIVYLHKFLMSLLMFVDHFQTAKEALSTATEKAASSVHVLAQKSFRLSMDIRLKAPLIIIPQSSTSQNALLVDLGLITVENMFTLLPVHGFALPAVMDKIEVKLTALKLCRTTLKLVSAPPDIEILQPINLELLVTRNLAASWFTQIPAVLVNGVLRSLQMSLGEEDLRVLMKILLENIGEGEVRRLMAQEKAELPEQQLDMSGSEGELDSTNDSPTENAVSILLDFEIQEVLLTLKKPQEGAESPFLLLQVANLGINTKLRRYNLCATTYIREINMKSLEFKDSSDEPLSLISSSVESGTELLKIQYFRADRSGPNFTSTYKNTKQMINVSFSSLDLVLHTEALLSTISFLSVALSVSTNPSQERQVRSKTPFARSSASRSEPFPGSATLVLPADGGVIDIKVMMSLGAFNVLVCNQTCNMAHIKIQGLNGSLLMQGSQTHISARLRDFIVLNVDPQSCHRKAVSIVGDEVFSFAMSLTPNATEGASYADISRTDGKLKLTVGCIQVVYWHQFFLSLLIFTNHFQTAKEALTTATAHAAEKAASSVRHLAQKSIRLSVDINLKAPLIVIPQSSTSHNALVMDLGLLRVENTFSLLPLDIYPLPAVIDTMEVQLTQLKLSRTCLELMEGGPSIELLEPVNLQLSIKRNLAASWFKEMVPVEIDGDLKPMKVKLSQEDLKMLLRILVENLGETGSLEPTTPRQEVIDDLQATGGSPIDDVRMPTGASEEEEKGILETLKFNFNFESLGLVLYINDLKQPLDQQHQENLRLGEFTLHLLKASGILTNSSLEVTTILTACTLDDLRTGLERVTSRVLGCRDQKVSEPMIDVTYRQSTGTREVIAVIQNLYLCASVEFLVAVTDFFLQALGSSQSSRPVLSSRVPLRQSTEPLGDVRTSTTYETSKTSKSNTTASGVMTKVRTVVVDPEVVFVASLMKTDAPALMASFQCDMTLQVQEDGTRYMKANLRSLKILACPFIHSKEDKAVTTVLRPCSVALQTRTHPNQPLSGSVTVEDVMIKISPVILKTLLTISAAMTSTQTEVGNQEPEPNTIDLWSVQNIYEGNYWFLGVDQAAEVTESFRNQDGHNQGETFCAEVKVVQLTLESGLGHRTVPLLLAESSFSGSAKNWSSLLKLRAEMTLEVNYFNEVHAVWEPLIERVDGGRRRWNLELEMKNSPVQEESPAHGDHVMIFPEPRTAISIWSKDTLNMTVTPSALRVLQNLSKEFSEGTTSTFDSTNNEKAPFTIRNSLGVPLIVQHSANLRPMGTAEAKYHELPVDQTLDLEPSSFERSSQGNLSALQQQESCLFKITIVPSGFSEISNVAIDKPGRHLYNVRGPMLQEVVSVLLQIDAAAGYKFITVRSPLQIINHFSIPFSILEFCPATQSLQIIGEAQPDKEFHIALESYRNQLFVRPAGSLDGQYGPSSTCMAWKEQVHRSFVVRSVIQCPAVGGRLLPLMVSTLAVPDDLRHITNYGEDNWDPAYIIHLHPVATLRNLLPYNIRYLMENTADSFELKEGTTTDLLNARVSGEVVSLVLVSYQGRDWNGHFGIKEEMPEFFSVCLTCDSDHKLAVEVSMHVIKTASCLLLSLFSPYWIINKTSRILQYRAEDVSVKHAADCRDIILFSFKKKTLFSKNKLQLCVSNSSWSESFSLDTVGSFGCVRCPAHNMDFLVGVSIHVSSFNLTRIVTIRPFFTLVNKSSYELEVGDVTGHGNIRWLYIPSLESSPLWPENSSGTLCLRMVGSDSASKFFFFDRQDSGTLLSLDVCGGIIVDVNITDLSTVISFTNYYEGAAPALLLNHTPWVTISYQQSGSLAVHQLKPGDARRFAWDNPTAVRMLSWSYMEQSGELDLLKDEAGQFSYDSLTQVHWVSFLDGRQRVLLFTEDVTIVTKARQAEELEQFQQEVKVSLKKLGLSLINNTSRKEIAYIGITSSGVVWEMKPKNRWKPFSQKNINLLEQTYQNQLRGETTGAWVKLETNLEVNLGGANMMMRKPFSCQIRRSFLSGILVELKKSQHQRSLRAKLHHLQVDNQLPGAIFPVVFHPVPPPKSIALDSEPKPFIDVSVITRFNRHSSVTQFKYFMVLVQEMAVKLDQGFLAAILAVFTTAADPQACRQKLHLIDRDLELLKTEPMETALNDALGLNFFQNFHISPIKLHLSLSLGDGGCGEEVPEETAALQSFNLLLKSIGATLTDVDDIVFKLAFFEVRYQFYRSEALMWVVLRHYSEQFLKQMYVLVLGLDVLGNPFGLIRGLSQGVEAFFYEPFQGAVQGPEEFAEGFVIGVRSLLGHTVGGAAGMVSRITGSVGKGLAAITMDKEYQQKRREEMNRPPKDFGESLAKGGKGLLKGVVGGVTGIITKPVEGAKKEGAAGFFKGIGKGLVGVVARPTGGIVDMASSTFQGIQRAAELTEEVTKLRPVRVIREDGIIRPYDLTESQGFDLFQHSGIKQLEGEVFRDHYPYAGHQKTTVIITNRRVVCVKQVDFVSHVSREWECLLENLTRPPVISGSGLTIYYKQQKLRFSPRDGQETIRTVQLPDPNTAQKLQTSISDALAAQQQHRMVRQKSQRFLKVKRK